MLITHTPLAHQLEELLRTPGATRAVLVWVDDACQQLCHTDIYPGSASKLSTLPAAHTELYIIGRFTLDGYGGTPSVRDAINVLRSRHGLDPIRDAMFGSLRAVSAN